MDKDRVFFKKAKSIMDSALTPKALVTVGCVAIGVGFVIMASKNREAVEEYKETKKVFKDEYSKATNAKERVVAVGAWVKDTAFTTAKYYKWEIFLVGGGLLANVAGYNKVSKSLKVVVDVYQNVETLKNALDSAVGNGTTRNDKVVSNVVNVDEVLIDGSVEVLFYEPHTGRYFHQQGLDIPALRAVIAELNNTLVTEMTVTLNDFYYSVGLDPVDAGDYLGWSIDHTIEPSIRASIKDGATQVVIVDLKPRLLHELEASLGFSSPEKHMKDILFGDDK